MESIKWEGAHGIKRTQGEHVDVLMQKLDVSIGETAIRYVVKSNRYGIEIPVPSDDPAVIELFREIDRAQMNAELLDRDPLPEPTRDPVDGIPANTRACWVCNGTGSALDEFDCMLECANCHGCGFVGLDS